MRITFSRALCALVFFLVAAASAHAQVPRLWVSGVGDDVNPGSRTAPCKTFAGGISKAQAGGEIDALDPGGYGTVSIVKSITIDGGGGKMASILFSGTQGVIVNAAATDVVVLRRLSLNGGGTGTNGVRFIQGGLLVVEDCDIANFTQSGIAVDATAGRLVISNTSISNGATGVKMSAAASNASADGLLVTATTNGIDLLAGTVDLSNSNVTQNTGAGLFAEGGTINSINNVVSGNGQDVKFTGGVVKTFDNAGPIGISLTQDVTTQTVSAGQSATYNLTVAPPPGGFSQPVTFAAVGLPSSLQCAFNPTTLPAGSGTSAVAMTVSPLQSAAGLPTLPALPTPWGLAATAALALLGFSLARQGVLRPRFAALLPAAALLVLLATARTAGAAPVSGTFAFTVTATSGSTSVSQLFTVIIK